MGVYQLVGGDGSPYSVKLRAVLRYRRIPHEWVPQFQLGTNMFETHFPSLKAKVIPVLVRPDGSYTNDSTPIIQELDATFSSRKVVPDHPVFSFLAACLEDFADEWMTKVMFEGRFHTEEDAMFGATWQMRQSPELASSAASKPVIEMFAKRQVKRRGLVGCSNWVAMEKTLRKVCEILEENLNQGNAFLFGKYPTNADFALYGQLRQLATDPFPSRIMHEYPGAWAWVFRVEDLSGLPFEAVDWSSVTQIPFGAKALLHLAAETYFPFLAANEAALSNGLEKVSVDIFQGAFQHEQPPFRYQLRCLGDLRMQFARVQPGRDLDLVQSAFPQATDHLALFKSSAKL